MNNTNSSKVLETSPSAILAEKKAYERRLIKLLEDIRTAALGIDYQPRLELRNLEKKVIDKLRELEAEIKSLVRNHKELNTNQGKLF